MARSQESESITAVIPDPVSSTGQARSGIQKGFPLKFYILCSKFDLPAHASWQKRLCKKFYHIINQSALIKQGYGRRVFSLLFSNIHA
jgi:hypothetical protein